MSEIRKIEQKTDPSISHIAIVGAGGIGSIFCSLLNKLISGGQVRVAPPEVAVFDFDTVSESNLRHQDFGVNELHMPKPVIMGMRYGFAPIVRRFVGDDVKDYELIVVCADNPGVRRVIYEGVDARNKAATGGQFSGAFIDLRSEGDVFAMFTHRLPLEQLMESLGKDSASEVGVSCQIPDDRQAGIIQMGNFDVAVKGSQLLLNMVRNQPYPHELIGTVL